MATKKAPAKKAATAKVKAKPKATQSAAGETDLVRRVTNKVNAKRKEFPQFQTGDSVGVYVKVKEGEKERIQLFAGVVLKVQGSGIGRSFTVRKMASGVGVERTFPMASPILDRVEIVSRGKVRRARLFYLRGLKGRSARLDALAYTAESVAAPANEATAEAAPAADAPAANVPAKETK